MAEMLDVTDESFEREVPRSETPVLVDFWGEHCPACRGGAVRGELVGARSKAALLELVR
jgi:thiol-disulfide isomerase/thioredoxin